MTIAVYVPAPLRQYCDGATELPVKGSTVRSVLKNLEQSHPSLYQSVCDETGAVRRHVNLFVNDDFISERNGLDTTMKSGDTLTIMPAVSGG